MRRRWLIGAAVAIGGVAVVMILSIMGGASFWSPSDPSTNSSELGTLSEKEEDFDIREWGGPRWGALLDAMFGKEKALPRTYDVESAIASLDTNVTVRAMPELTAMAFDT